MVRRRLGEGGQHGGRCDGEGDRAGSGDHGDEMQASEAARGRAIAVRATVHMVNELTLPTLLTMLASKLVY